MEIETLLALCLGLSLSAACGFRVFIPPLAMSIGAIYGDFELASGWEWIGTYPALMTLAIAAFLELCAYCIPAVDNLLDGVEIPLAITVGTILTAATIADVNPLLQWTIAVVMGGGSAGAIDGVTSATRLASTTLTGGIGNPVLSITEALSATVLSLMAFVVPVLAVVVVFMIFPLALRQPYKRWVRYRQSSRSSQLHE